MRTPEWFEKRDIKDYLAKLPAWHFSPFMAGMGPAGIPDIVACIPITITPEMVGMRLGIFAGCEVKRDKREPTPLQKQRMREIEEAGGFAYHGTAEMIIPLLKKLPWK